MTKVKPSNGNETKSDIFLWEKFKSDTTSKYFHEFQNQIFWILWLKWTQTIEMNPNHIFFHGAYSNLTLYMFRDQKILKYLNDFQNWNFSVLWLKWTQTMELKQNQTFFRGVYSNLTLFFICPKILENFNDSYNWHFSISL